MTLKFQIESWNVVMIDNNPNNRRPAIYIKADKQQEEFLSSLPENDIGALIKGTYSIYNDIVIPGKIYSTSNEPNFRPRFFMEKGYLLIVLDFMWFGYPSYGSPLGEIEVIV